VAIATGEFEESGPRSGRKTARRAAAGTLIGFALGGPAVQGAAVGAATGLIGQGKSIEAPAWNLVRVSAGAVGRSLRRTTSRDLPGRVDGQHNSAHSGRGPGNGWPLRGDYGPLPTCSKANRTLIISAKLSEDQGEEDDLAKGLLTIYGSADFVAFKAAWSLASSSCESEVVKILPPRPFSSSNTRSLSEVGLLVRTKSADLLGISTCGQFFHEAIGDSHVGECTRSQDLPCIT